MAGEHKHPNYMTIFYWLAILTLGEIGVVFLPHYIPMSKVAVGVFLCAFAVVKAAMVAMYFMHLKFETRTLGLIAVTGFFLLRSLAAWETPPQLALWLPFVVVFPLWFFRYSRSLWLALEYALNPEP